ncbi:MAG: TlpA family protein disulfide reductase, partial [Candidatus Methylomirabilales bacterium]
SKGPEFVLPILGGEGTLASKQLEGKPIVVNFWASWCVPCREEAPLLERAWRSYRGQGIKFLGVNTQDAEEDALDFVREFEITYPNVRDVNQELGGQMGVLGLPETFFIDHRYRFAGASAGEQIGTRGKTVIRGAISSAVLRGNVEALLARMREP